MLLESEACVTSRRQSEEVPIGNGTTCLGGSASASEATCVMRWNADNSAPTIGTRRGPLRVMFLLTDMRIGGAEMVTANIIRRLDRARFMPELCCLKQLGELGEQLMCEVPVYHSLLRNKYDLCILPRLTRLLRRRRTDAVITIGAGDKMFWGRLAARGAGVPVILSAIHSTGWPDGVGRLNRLLTPITDQFIAVAQSHGQHLIKNEGFPANQVTVIPNGVDTKRFAPFADAAGIRRDLGIEACAPVVGTVAALRPEKHHELFLEMAKRVVRQIPTARFVIVGDGPCRQSLEQRTGKMGLARHVLFLGSRPDVPNLLAAMNVFALTSHNEANPMSILEAMSLARPVVATNVGSIREAVIDGQTGYLVKPGDAQQLTERVLRLLNNQQLQRTIGAAARTRVIEYWSVENMVRGYEQLIESIYERKLSAQGGIAEPLFSG
jgi:glycosyltransferase involved in cell wall biosynthesis